MFKAHLVQNLGQKRRRYTNESRDPEIKFNTNKDTYPNRKKKLTAAQEKSITIEYNQLQAALTQLRKELEATPEDESDKRAIYKDTIRKTEQKADEKFELYSQIPDKITDKIEETAKGQLSLLFFKRERNENVPLNAPPTPAVSTATRPNQR